VPLPGVGTYIGLEAVGSTVEAKDRYRGHRLAYRDWRAPVALRVAWYG